ncbi:subclass B3 metallo-beta-lactamase [Novosphingobium terrae]|uniref:subclass B3 metallo-beta-lactamase n=1 Tax=Novosphingobium terrae TaxID=2726189 RepID=UPI001F13F385|nr:subclass B3 metallo-beta-lactamase [Novosphingobium terrae]
MVRLTTAFAMSLIAALGLADAVSQALRAETERNTMPRLTTTLAMSLIAALGAAPALAAKTPADDPLLRPIAPAYSAKRFLTPAQPVRVYGNTYLVGFGGVSVALIRTSAGLILIDGSVPQGVRAVEEHMRALGFSIRDVKLILSTEPHFDHAGGIAALERDSGATVLAGAAAVPVLRAHGLDPSDPQASGLERFPAPRNIRAVRDGERITLGDVTVTAVAMPGHTPGSTSWSWKSCEGQRCETVVFAASINAVALGGYRFSTPAHRGRVEVIRRSITKLRGMPCDLVLTSHPELSDGEAKQKQLLRQRSPNPFIDPQGCRKAADAFEKRLSDQLAEEAKR